MADVQAQIAALREAFARELPARLDGLIAAWEAEASLETCAQLRFEAHRLVGSASTFGFAALAQAARNLEGLLQDLLDRSAPPEPEDRPRIAGRLADLHRLTLQLAPVPDSAGPSSAPVVGFAPGNEEDLALQQQLERLGYIVRPPGPGAFDALILDAEAPLPEKGIAPEAPRLFLSAQGDMESRLRALRAGSLAYFSRPVNAPALADRLDALCARQPPDPYRVLVVDDDPHLARHLALTLQSAGMIARDLADPLTLLEVLMDWRPDLLLLDMHMPSCTGLEVAAVVRQMESLTGLPIVFLSGEQDFARQMDAMGQGADDFLTKPIAPERLVAQVTHRAWRGRLLQGRMTRDSLTGLLNHSALLDRLEAEVARAQRLNGALAFAMTDLDHFKRVNDTHGHGIGDQVLRAFARLLQHRLRRSDALGRYGGEEFGIVLPDTGPDEAHALLEGLRKDFAAFRFQGASGEFQVTFSAGLALWPPYHQASALCDAADQALYAAKAAGRNRVETAPEPDPSC